MTERIADLHVRIDRLQREIEELERHLQEKDHIIANQVKIIHRQEKAYDDLAEDLIQVVKERNALWEDYNELRKQG